jgi:hypothetical protein
MLIAEELLLLGLDPGHGRPYRSASTTLRTALCGALVAELALTGHVVVDGRRFTATGQPAPNNALLAAVHRELSGPKGRRSADQLRRLDRAVGAWAALLDGLVAQGVVQRQRSRILGFPVTRYPLDQPFVRDEVLARVRAAALSQGELEPRTGIVLALAEPAGLLKILAPDRDSRRQAKQRARQAADAVPVAAVVKKVISEAQTAAAAVAVSSSIAASS